MASVAHVRAWIWVVGALGACAGGPDVGISQVGGGVHAALEAASSDSDAGSPELAVADADAGPIDACGVSTITTQEEPDGITVERFSYLSDGLTILGASCKPAGPGPHPVLLYNHGGVVGLYDNDYTMCRRLARHGIRVLMPEYRGQGGSDGSIELCLGEVDDVLQLLACAASFDDVDPGRIVMMGWSHGGCVTLRALQRGAQVRAAIDLDGVTDWVGIHAFVSGKLALEHLGDDLRAVYADVIEKLEGGAYGPPEERPDAYTERSPLAFVRDLDGFAGDLLVIHGTEDAFVPVQQACALAAAHGGFQMSFVDGDGVVADRVPAVCEAAAPTPTNAPVPTHVQLGARHLEIYAGAGHGIYADSVPAGRISNAVLRFLAAHLGP